MLKQLILASALLSLVGCAFNKDDNGAKNRELAQNEKLSDTYRPLLGTWSGKLTTETGVRDVSIEFFTLNAMDGTTDADGAERVRKVLRANYRRINPVGENYRFKVGFSQVTGQVSFTNIAGSLGSDDVHTIDAVVKGDQIVGEAKSETRVVGVLNLRLTSRSSNTGGGTEENEYNERLRAQLQVAAGEYTGKIAMSEGKTDVEVRLNVVNVTDSSGKKVPTLTGSLRILTGRGNVNLNLTALYEADLNPAKLTLTGKYPQSNTDYTATIEGTLVNGAFVGTFSTNVNGLVQPIEFKKAQ